MTNTSHPVASGCGSSRTNRGRAIEREDRKALLLIAALALVMFLPGLGSFGLIDPSEAYYAESGREMLAKNEWVIPLLNYEPWFEKPALTAWLIASSYRIAGVCEFAARLPSALLGIGLVLATYLFTRRITRRRSALFSALALATSPLFLVVGHLSLTDMPFTFCLSFALFSFLGMMVKPSRLCFWCAYISLGLGALAKGPLAFAFAGLIVGIFLILSSSSFSDFLSRVKALRPLEGLLVTLAVAAPWYVAVCVATHGAFAQEFFIKQNIGRAAGMVNHNYPVWFYFPFLVGGLAPWSLLLFAAPKVLVRHTHLREKHSRRESLIRYAAIWSIVVLLVLSAVSSKLATYLLPVCPAVAVLAGTWLDTMIRLRRGQLLAWTGPVLALVGIGAIVLLPFLLHGSHSLILPSLFTTVLVTAGLIAYALFLYKKKPGPGLACLIGSTAFGAALMVPLGINAFYDYHERGYRQILETVKQSDASVALLGPIQSSTFYYLDRHVPVLEDGRDIDKFVGTTCPPHWLITTKHHMELLKSTHPQLTVLMQKRAWYLLSLGDRQTDPSDPRCTGSRSIR